MPIVIPNNLPATEVLKGENIFVMNESRASTQQIRPLEILLLNLMPKKIETETQIARLIGNTPIQVHLNLLIPTSHHPKNTPMEHLIAFYNTFDEIKDKTSGFCGSTFLAASAAARAASASWRAFLMASSLAIWASTSASSILRNSSTASPS